MVNSISKDDHSGVKTTANMHADRQTDEDTEGDKQAHKQRLNDKNTSMQLLIGN